MLVQTGKQPSCHRSSSSSLAVRLTYSYDTASIQTIDNRPQISQIDLYYHTRHAVILFIFVLPYLGQYMSWAFLAVSILIILFVFTMMGMTAFRDPGFYPRSPPNSDVEFGYVHGIIYPSVVCTRCRATRTLDACVF